MNDLQDKWLIVIDGTVGAGKSLLLEKLDRLNVPGVQTRCEVLASERLALLSESSSRRGTEGGMNMYFELKMLADSISRVCDESDARYLVVERWFASCTFFLPVLERAGRLTKEGADCVRGLVESLDPLFRRPGGRRVARVYLDTSPRVALERICKRGRDGEQFWALDRLEALRAQHSLQCEKFTGLLDGEKDPESLAMDLVFLLMGLSGEELPRALQKKQDPDLPFFSCEAIDSILSDAEKVMENGKVIDEIAATL